MVYSTINSLQEEIFRPLNDVYAIFKDFFGEDKVDLQIGNYSSIDCTPYVSNDIVDTQITDLRDHISEASYPFIMVYWPEVKVTNEHNKSITIQDLYAKVPVNLHGYIPFSSVGFYLNRSRYSKKQFSSNYLHSHIQRIPTDNYQHFLEPCLGRGPIKNTITALKTNNSAVTWMLFCQELSMYVTVESLSGGPWKRLEEVGIKNHRIPVGKNRMSEFITFESPEHTNTIINILRDFIPYYLRHGKFIFDYTAEGYDIGMSFFEIVITMSNCFIEYFNNSKYKNYETINILFNSGTLQKVSVINGSFYSPNNTNYSRHMEDSGKLVCTFKGNPVYLVIEEDEEEETFSTTILKNDYVNCILNNILKVINYRYGNTTTDSSTASESTIFL